MNFNFSDNINDFLKIIAKNAQAQSKRVFFVGGIVRDKILGVDTFDIDLLFEGNAIEFAKKLPPEIQIKSLHKDFCTAKVVYQNIEIDIASSRTENYPYSGCLPVLDEVGVAIEKDVLRRDFSVNSLYAQIKLIGNELKFELIDLVNGLEGIENKTLKVLHKKSYIDDPTRIIRGLGFKHRFGFDFSQVDKDLIANYLSKIDYSNMSHDRNLKVFKKVLELKFQDEIFKEIINKKYYKLINPDELNLSFKKIEEITKTFDLSIKQKAEFYFELLMAFCCS